jgi:hypothetical protein
MVFMDFVSPHDMNRIMSFALIVILVYKPLFMTFEPESRGTFDRVWTGKTLALQSHLNFSQLQKSNKIAATSLGGSEIHFFNTVHARSSIM